MMKNAIMDKVTFLVHAEAAYNRSIQPEKIQTCTCSKCSKVVEFIEKEMERDFLGKPPMHFISLGLQGYTSRFDGSFVSFELCDECLGKTFDSLTPEAKEAIVNS